MNDIITWLKNYFSKKNELPNNVEKLNYFEAGLIDSFGIITLIYEIEKKYDIKFDQNALQDRRFVSIEGIAKIISEIKKNENV